jgi:DNA-binding XRE family transcriptional regulator
VCEIEGRRGDIHVKLGDLGVPRRPKIVAARPSAEFEGVVQLVHAGGSTLEVPTDHILYVLSPAYDPAAEARARAEIQRRIAQRLRQRRTALGLTAEFVARRAGLSRPNYARMESGRRLHRLDVLERVADVLRASIADFVAREPPRWAGADLPAADSRRGLHPQV